MKRNTGRRATRRTTEPLTANAAVMAATSLHSVKAKEEAPLPAALQDLSNILSSAEANQAHLRDRLHRVLDSSEMDGAAQGSGLSAPNQIEPKLTDVVYNIANRVRDLIDSQQDVLTRLHV